MTLITEKYDYQPIHRITVNKKRLYETPDGDKLPSVTTILSNTKDKADIKKLNEWRKRVGHNRAEAITTAAASRGTRMHTFLEKYVSTGVFPDSGTNPFSIESHKMALTIKDNVFNKIDEIWGMEVPLYVPKLYAGSADVVGVYEGRAFIGDFKQSNKEKKGEWVKDYFLQCTAYRLCHNELYDTDITNCSIFVCTKDCVFQQFDLTSAPDPYFNKTCKDWENEWWDRVYRYYEQFVK